MLSLLLLWTSNSEHRVMPVGPPSQVNAPWALKVMALMAHVKVQLLPKEPDEGTAPEPVITEQTAAEPPPTAKSGGHGTRQRRAASSLARALQRAANEVWRQHRRWRRRAQRLAVEGEGLASDVGPGKSGAQRLAAKGQRQASDVEKSGARLGVRSKSTRASGVKLKPPMESQAGANKVKMPKKGLSAWHQFCKAFFNNQPCNSKQEARQRMKDAAAEWALQRQQQQQQQQESAAQQKPKRESRKQIMDPDERRKQRQDNLNKARKLRWGNDGTKQLEPATAAAAGA